MSPFRHLDADLAFAIDAARSAGSRALALRSMGRWEGDLLGDVADQANDGFLHGLIEGRYPDDGILSEETEDTDDRLLRERVWIVDPLDGTKEYGQGRDDWAIHVALAVHGRPVVGAVSLPAQDRVLWGVDAGEGTTRGFDGEGEVLAGDSSSAGRLRIACSRSHTPPWVEGLAKELEGDLVRAGSVGNKVSLLLLGEADVYVHKVGLKEWDTCAPEAVARAYGWRVCKLRGEDHAYNQRDARNHELVVCRPADEERVLAAVAASGALEG